MAYVTIHTYTEKYSDEFKSLISQDIHSGSVCVCVCVHSGEKSKRLKYKQYSDTK